MGWIAARGRGADDGILGRVMHGIFLDVTGRKQLRGHRTAGGGNESPGQEPVSHSHGADPDDRTLANSVEDMARDLTQRLTSLGRAHDFVRPLPNEQGKAALLGDLLSILLAPYDETAAFSGRIRVSVARMGVGEKAATALAMVIHELATNSVKYGSLSVETGFLDVSSKMEDECILVTWTETGGPQIFEARSLKGFGSKLIARSVSGQLGGELIYDWQKSGLVVTVRMRREKLEK